MATVEKIVVELNANTIKKGLEHVEKTIAEQISAEYPDAECLVTHRRTGDFHDVHIVVGGGNYESAIAQASLEADARTRVHRIIDRAAAGATLRPLLGTQKR